MAWTDAENLYLPRPARIEQIISENSQIKTFRLAFTDPLDRQGFTHQPGQFMMVSVPHCGEAAISISSPPTRPGSLELSVRRAGKLTAGLHQLEAGRIIGLRGPFGRPFPMTDLQDRDLLFVAGGIGLAPLRSVLNHCLDQGHSGRITILYGSRSPQDIAFKKDLAIWQQTPGVSCRLTVDEADPVWDGPVGVVTDLLPEIELDPQRSTALVCGPPLMIRFVLAELSRLGFGDDRIITTLERHMKCGVGVCGHCHLDGRMVCTDGPVFTRSELQNLRVTELSE